MDYQLPKAALHYDAENGLPGKMRQLIARLREHWQELSSKSMNACARSKQPPAHQPRPADIDLQNLEYVAFKRFALMPLALWFFMSVPLKIGRALVPINSDAGSPSASSSATTVRCGGRSRIMSTPGMVLYAAFAVRFPAFGCRAGGQHGTRSTRSAILPAGKASRTPLNQQPEYREAVLVRQGA